MSYYGALASSLRCTSQLSRNLILVTRQDRMDPLKPTDPKALSGIALRGRLGRDGTGTVYFSVMPDGERVAVKTIREDLIEKSEARGRFDREALAIGMVQGPRVAHLVAASDPDEAPQDTPPWFEVEYVRGLTLAEYVGERGPLPAEAAAALGIGLAVERATRHQLPLQGIHSPGA